MLLGIPIVIGSALTAVFITTANAFMNWPTGFDITGYLANGTISAINPYAVFYSPYAANEISHVLSSAYFAGTFIFIALFAYMALKAKDPRVKGYYVKGLKLLIVLGVIFTLASIYTGTTSISDVLNLQPEKYAALEGNLQPMANAPEVISIPLQNGSFVLFKIPYLQSILATGSPNGTVPGLSSYPLSTQPPLIVHFLFDVMVIMGFAILGLLALVAVLQVLKKKPLDNRIVLALLVVSGALALLILEDGWVMAESARQPWIVYGIMNVTAAGNASLSVIPIGGAILAFYIMVIPAAVIVIRYALRDRPLEKELK
jgi:cytochrome d ubiquinol oxidase subunit I